jgi:hypothetical protein
MVVQTGREKPVIEEIQESLRLESGQNEDDEDEDDDEPGEDELRIPYATLECPR